MAEPTPRPTEDLAAVDAAVGLLLEAIARMTDTDARAPSLLPGWSRGHVLTHVARNADAFALAVDGAVRGGAVDMYPGGDEQRTRDIEAGAMRPVDALRDDVRATQHGLDTAWSRVEDGMWDREIRALAGRRTVAGSVHIRRREVLVHLVDLDVGVAPGDLPADYLERDADYLRENRTREAWPDAPW
jgi:maleylpyruvate isomerase